MSDKRPVPEFMKAPQRPMDTKTLVEKLRRQVRDQEVEIKAQKETLEKMTKALHVIGEELNLQRQMVMAHVKHITDLPNNPHFLRALLTKIEMFDAETAQLEELRAAGRWVDPALHPCEAPADLAAETRHIYLLRREVRPSDQGEPVLYPVAYGIAGSEWKEVPLSYFEAIGLFPEHLNELIPGEEGGAELYVEFIPGHPLPAEEAPDEIEILFQTAISIGGESALDSVRADVFFTSEAQAEYSEHSFQIIEVPVEGEFKLVLNNYHENQDYQPLPEDVVTDLVDQARPFISTTRPIVYVNVLPDEIPEASNDEAFFVDTLSATNEGTSVRFEGATTEQILDAITDLLDGAIDTIFVTGYDEDQGIDIQEQLEEKIHLIDFDRNDETDEITITRAIEIEEESSEELDDTPDEPMEVYETAEEATAEQPAEEAAAESVVETAPDLT